MPGLGLQLHYHQCSLKASYLEWRSESKSLTTWWIVLLPLGLSILENIRTLPVCVPTQWNIFQIILVRDRYVILYAYKLSWHMYISVWYHIGCVTGCSLNVCVRCSQRPKKFSVMMLGDELFYFTRVATIM